MPQPPYQEVSVRLDINSGTDQRDRGPEADQGKDDDIFGHRHAGIILVEIRERRLQRFDAKLCFIHIIHNQAGVG